MDIRSFFNRSAASKPNCGIKDKLGTPEKRSASDNSDCAQAKSPSSNVKQRSAKKPPSKKDTKRKNVAVSMSSESDPEDPIPSKLLKLMNGKDAARCEKIKVCRRIEKQRRVTIDDSDSSDNDRQPTTSNLTKIQKPKSPQKKHSSNATAKRQKSPLKKTTILPVVNLDNDDDNSELEEVLIFSAKKHPLENGNVKKTSAKRKATLELKLEKEKLPRRKVVNDKEISKNGATDNVVKTNERNSSAIPAKAKDVPGVKKMNPISVSDFFSGTKVKPRQPNEERVKKEKDKEKHSDDEFNDVLQQAECELLSPSTVASSRSKLTPVKKKSKDHASKPNIEDEVTSSLTPRKSPRVVGQNDSSQNSTIVVGRSQYFGRCTPSQVSPSKNIRPESDRDSIKLTLLKKPPPKKTEPKKSTPKKAETKKPPAKPASVYSSQNSSVSNVSLQEGVQTDQAGSSSLLVDKYRPKSVKQIIGQQGEKSCVNKLLSWLRNWNAWHVTKTKEKKKGFGANDNGSCYKCVLLSGPPGIGKTTSAELCCQELGIKYIAKNASDTRSKKSLELQVMETLNSHNMNEYCGDNKNPVEDVPKHALIMDEVDGMAGNEDRSGISELIAFIKKTKIPLMCICNDRQSQKIRSLANYCYDLRFHRPQVSQIKGPMMSVAFKERIKVSSEVLEQLIEASNHDVRQIMYRLSLLTPDPDSKAANANEAPSHEIALGKKDITTNIFEIIRQIFADDQRSGVKRKSWHEKCELFFLDYSLTPLFTFENYLNVEIKDAKKMSDKLKAIAQASSYMAIGDMVEKQIRLDGNWSLLNDQAILSVVAPAENVRGYLKGAAQFPQWFGKNSKQNKNSRLTSQLQMHTCLKTSCNTKSFNLDYAPLFREKLLRPLLSSEKNGPENVVNLLQHYGLTKTDMDNILELTQYPNTNDSLSKVPAKTKASLTRLYNKTCHVLPFSDNSEVTTMRKKKKGEKITKELTSTEADEDEVEEELDDNGDNIRDEIV